MSPSKLLKHFLRTGEKPTSQRDSNALLDESRSILASKLPTTGETIQMFSDGEIDSILAGGKPGVMDRAYAIYNEKEGRYVPTGKPLAARPTPAPRPAPAPVATSKPVIHRAAATATKPSAPAPSPELTGLARTAAAFKSSAPASVPRHNRVSTVPLTGIARTAAAFAAKQPPAMPKAEFENLSHKDRAVFLKMGGKITR